MVFYKTNLSQICHQISLVTTFSRTLQRLGFKVDNGQENTTVLKRKETKRQSITTTITKRKNRHSRATQEHPDMKGENIRAYSYHKKTWEFGARKIEELGSLTREKWNWSAERDREQNLLRWQESEGRTLERRAKQLGTKIGFDGRLFGRFWSFQRLCFGGDFCSSRNSRVFLPAFLVPFLGGGGGKRTGLSCVDCFNINSRAFFLKMSHHQPSSNNVFPIFWYQKFGGFFRRNRKNSRIYTRTNNFFPKLFKIFPKNKNICGKTFTITDKVCRFSKKEIGKILELFIF